MPNKLSEEIINAAIDGFKAQRNRLDQGIAELSAMLNGSSPQAGAASKPAPGKRRKNEGRSA